MPRFCFPDFPTIFLRRLAGGLLGYFITITYRQFDSDKDAVVPRPWEVTQFLFFAVHLFDTFAPVRAMLEFCMGLSVQRENTATV